jgi:hypothetical protein
MAFVRLTNNQYFDHMAEYHLKVRFLFIFLGPQKNVNYLEIGRCMGTLMSNKDFYHSVYRAHAQIEVVKAVSNYLSRSLCIVLPSSDFDIDLLLPIIDWLKPMLKAKAEKDHKKNRTVNFMDNNSNSKVKKSGNQSSNFFKVKSTNSNNANFDNNNDNDDDDEDGERKNPFERTGFMFGCLKRELKTRYSQYFSDILDGLNFHCLIAVFFIFTVCLAPALSFGGILADKTGNLFGVKEMLIATSLNGVIFGLLSGQPLMIFGATGPFLVFEDMIYRYSLSFCIEYLATRCWVALWVLFFAILIVAFECVFLIEYVTRFTEEIFTILIAIVFLSDALKKIISNFQMYPVKELKVYCNQSFLTETFHSEYDEYENCNLNEMYTTNTTSNYNDVKYEPNVALISTFLLILTCILALILKKLRRSAFFGSYVSVFLLLKVCLLETC